MRNSQEGWGESVIISGMFAEGNQVHEKGIWYVCSVSYAWDVSPNQSQSTLSTERLSS